MLLENRVYCLRCSSVIAEKEAGTVFRTGFYQVTTRLGFCSACAGANGMETDAAATILAEPSGPAGNAEATY